MKSVRILLRLRLIDFQMADKISRIIIENIKLPISASEKEAFEAAKVRISKHPCFGKALSFEIYKRSIDARKKENIQFVMSVIAEVETLKSPDEGKLKSDGIKLKTDLTPHFTPGKEIISARPVVVGFGPAGMFAALYLARYGYRPIVLERGASVGDRVKAVERFEKEGMLDTETNIQFGAGGAGTFSDGKLTTRINDPFVHAVLKELRDMGAPEDVVTRAKPHIGTDVLRKVVEAFHKEIERLGGEIRYLTRVTAVTKGVVSTDSGDIPSGATVIATGHSARDFYKFLIDGGFAVECKPFSVGVRIEHLQRDIDIAMYGSDELSGIIGHAEYALSYRKGERGVYTFCMCPGGKVVAAASEEGGVVTNGMSYRARDGKNANAALAVSVLPSDFGSDPLKGIEFQRKLERAAFKAGGENYHAPSQNVKDFFDGRRGEVSERIKPSYMDGKVTPCDLNMILPSFVSSMLKTGISQFGRKINGYDDGDVPLTGVETRTSAPMRILRTDSFEAVGKENIYPCGEGAGYAGGIVSAAVDGIRVAGAIIEKYAPLES